MGAEAETARRRVRLATVLLRPPSGHRPGRRQARHASDRTLPDATMKSMDAPSAWANLSNLDKTGSDGRDPLQDVEFIIILNIFSNRFFGKP